MTVFHYVLGVFSGAALAGSLWATMTFQQPWILGGSFIFLILSCVSGCHYRKDF